MAEVLPAIIFKQNPYNPSEIHCFVKLDIPAEYIHMMAASSHEVVMLEIHELVEKLKLDIINAINGG